MTVHLLCAFYRKYIYKTLIHYYEKEDIIFHPICDDVDIEPFKDNKLSWVQPYVCPPLRIPGDQVYKKFDYFMDGNELIENDFYGFIDDDSMFEPGFFAELKKHNDYEVVYNSCYRGDSVPNDGSEPHPIYPLIQNGPQDVYECNIGIGMFFVKGRVLKNIRFGNTHKWDDGRFAKRLLTETSSISFMPNWFVLGNYFQPGRHTNKSKFMKPNWELSQIIPTEYPVDWYMTYRKGVK